MLTRALLHLAVFDPSLAPPGKAVVHAYYAANEPYDIWKGLDPDSAEYKALKEERAQPLWQVMFCAVSSLVLLNVV